MFDLTRPGIRGFAAIAVISTPLILTIGACGGGEPAVQSPPSTPSPTIAATQIPPTATPTPEPSPISESVAVPINVKGAKDLGTLHIELVYDAAVLEAEGFELAELSQNALVEVNLDTPGRVVIGIIDTGGIKGDGPVVVISFKRIRQQGTSTLVLENVTAHSATTLIDVPTTVTSGTFSVSGGAISLLEIVFAGAK